MRYLLAGLYHANEKRGVLTCPLPSGLRSGTCSQSRSIATSHDNTEVNTTMRTQSATPRPNMRHAINTLDLRQFGHLPQPALTQKQWAFVIGAGVYAGIFVYCVIELISIALTF